MLLRLCPGFLIAACSVTLQALDPSFSVSQYHKQYWQVEQGLPHSYVTSIKVGPDGYLLIGTAEGLARFDGVSFRSFGADSSLGLAQRWISALLPARDGSLWIGTFAGGTLMQVREGHIVSRHQTSGSVFDLIEDKQGIIWASTRDGLLRWQNGTLTKQQGLRPPSETSWNVLSIDSTSTLWVVTADGLFQRSGSTFVQRLRNTTTNGDILTVRASRNGSVWVGTSKGLFRFKESATPITGVPGPIVSILEDRDGVLWAGCWGKGLYRVTSSRVERWSAAEGLSDDSIRTLAEDQEGNLWIGMRSGGLGRWRDTRIIPIGTPEGLAGNYATIVANAPDNSLWLGTWRGGLYRLFNGKVESQPVPLPTLYFAARALAFDPLGHPWIGNWEGLFEFDGRSYRRYADESGSPYGRVSALLFDRSGALWVGTSGRGLFRFHEGRPLAPPTPALLPDSEITALLESSDGSIWVGCTDGLRRIAPGGSVLENVPNLPAGSIHSIFEDSKHRIWAASTGALLLMTRGGQHILDRRNGLPQHSLYRVLEDYAGTFWVSSPRGIFSMASTSLDQVLAGARQDLSIVPYDQDSGMRTIECHGLSQPSGARAADGSLWFPTARGFIQIRPAAQQNLPAPRVVIEEVAANWGSAPISPTVELRPDTRNLTLRFTAPRFSSPGKLRFRYRMSGFDPDWVPAGTERTARYNRLPPGPHVFEVQARDPWGDWSTSASISLRQNPRFYQTWWFSALGTFSILGVFAAIYRWRLHRVGGRYAAVLEERNRIGREWHDTLVAGFSAISLQIEAAHASIATKPERASEILEMTRRIVHHYRAEARRVIWDLRDSRPEGETLPMAVEDALRRVIEHRGIQGAVAVEGQPVELPVELQHNVLRICQEAMSNSARHANPARIDVQLIFSPDSLKAVVRDNGCGLLSDPRYVEAAGHFGLTVMQERARRHGGTLRIDSRPGFGTTVEISIPLAGTVK